MPTASLIDNLLGRLESFLGGAAGKLQDFEELEGWNQDPEGKLKKPDGVAPVNTETFDGDDTTRYADEAECVEAGGFWIPSTLAPPSGVCVRGITGIDEWRPEYGIERITTGSSAGFASATAKGCCVHFTGACTADKTLLECMQTESGMAFWKQGYKCTHLGCRSQSSITTSTVTTTTTTSRTTSHTLPSTPTTTSTSTSSTSEHAYVELNIDIGWSDGGDCIYSNPVYEGKLQDDENDDYSGHLWTPMPMQVALFIHDYGNGTASWLLQTGYAGHHECDDCMGDDGGYMSFGKYAGGSFGFTIANAAGTVTITAP